MRTLRREAPGARLRAVPQRARTTNRQRDLRAVLEWAKSEEVEAVKLKGFLFGEVPQTAEIDTTKEGSVKW